MLSNIGSLGGDIVAPVLVLPLVGIVAMGKIRATPTYIDTLEGEEQLVKEEQMTSSWSVDYCLIDGATVTWAARIVEHVIKTPEQLLGEADAKRQHRDTCISTESKRRKFSISLRHFHISTVASN